jgi:hypothetical protein
MASDPRDLAPLHAVMDEVTALQAQRPHPTDPAELTQQVTQMYAHLGMDVDPALIAQAVATRTADARPDAPRAAFDFGWDRPVSPTDWEKKLSRRQRRTAFLASCLNASSSVAFFCWLWMVLGTVPPVLDHPWLFAFGCMGAGSVLETLLLQRRKADQQWTLAKPKSRKRHDWQRWKNSPRAQAYLAAVVTSQVPLLRADVAQLHARVEQDAQMAVVKSGLN